MSKTPYKDIVEIADTYGTEAAILLTSCESERDVQWARNAVLLEDYGKAISMTEYVVPTYYSDPSFEIKSNPRQIVIKMRTV